MEISREQGLQWYYKKNTNLLALKHIFSETETDKNRIEEISSK